MPQGLQVWDANGGLLFDTTTSLARILGMFRLLTNTGSITNPGLTTGEGWYVLRQVFLLDQYVQDQIGVDSVTINRATGTISWNVPPAENATVTDMILMYGVR